VASLRVGSSLTTKFKSILERLAKGNYIPLFFYTGLQKLNIFTGVFPVFHKVPQWPRENVMLDGPLPAPERSPEQTQNQLTDQNGHTILNGDAARTAAEVSATKMTAAEMTAAEMTVAEMTAAEMTAAEMTAAEMTAAEMTAAEMAAAEMAAAEMAAAEMTAAEMAAAEMAAAEMAAAEMAAAEMTAAEMTAAEMTAAKMTAVEVAAAEMTAADVTAAESRPSSRCQCLSLFFLSHCQWFKIS
jgi:hypothetical protein